MILNDTMDISTEAAEAAIQTDDWRFGYALTVHSSQGLTIKDSKKVDDYLHKIQYVCCCRPYISCCQMAHYNDDLLDSFEEEPLFGCLFGSEGHEGAEIFSEADRTSYDTMISHDQACEKNSGPSVENGLLECQNVGHTGMIPTRGATHEDTVHHPGETDLPCDSIFPNNHSAGILQNWSLW